MIDVFTSARLLVLKAQAAGNVAKDSLVGEIGPEEDSIGGLLADDESSKDERSPKEDD